MIHFQSFSLENGLRVIVHEDYSVPTTAFNLLYDVGSRDENPDKTGFAHLFEHLMFGGSANIPSYDTPLQQAGGENNAFTSADLTNYYLTLPTENLETAFWLESDRMLSLSFNPEVLEVQRKVVIEEFKQRYLNQPYGDAWLKLRPLAYKVHPYQWATIGKDISHIEQATMTDVKDFFFRYYRPNNAILVVAGNVSLQRVRQLSEKWFAPIPAGNALQRNLPQEPTQTQARWQTIEANVPLDAIYKAYHVPDKQHPDYLAADLMSDMLGRGKTSFLHKNLVQEQKIFSSINAYLTGNIDAGLLVITGKPYQSISLEKAEAKLQETIELFVKEGINERDLQKVKNQAEATLVYSEMEVLNRAMNLAYATLLGNTNAVNEESAKIQAVSLPQMQKVAAKTLKPQNCSTLHYLAMQKG